MRLYPLIFILGILLAACHDAPRKNPFDPALTPGVALVSATIDSTRGDVQLKWTPYIGTQEFSHYLVLRKIPELTAVDTVARIGDAGQNTFIDSSVSLYQDYAYRIAVSNQTGFTVDSPELLVGALDVDGVSISGIEPDPRSGSIALRWTPYDGPRFERYEIHREAIRSDGSTQQEVIGQITQASTTLFTDSDALPGTTYFYSVLAWADGQSLQSAAAPGRYELPNITLGAIAFDSQTAQAAIGWSQYRGPRFSAYVLYRRTPELAEQEVVRLTEQFVSTYIDSFLGGNTLYTYRVEVETTWPGIATSSDEQEGLFFALEEVVLLPQNSDAEVRALDIAVNDIDQIYAVATTILTTTANTMEAGVNVLFPESATYRSYLLEYTPDRLSPIFCTVYQDWIYLTFRTRTETIRADTDIIVAAIDPDRKLAWSLPLQDEGINPAGIHIDDDGTVLVINDLGDLYFIAPDGSAVEYSDKIRAGLGDEPVRHVIIGDNAGPTNLDEFFILVPEKDDHHIIGRSRPGRNLWGGRHEFDDGVGLEDGHTLTPLRIAYDATENRLIVVEEVGRLQLLNAAIETDQSRYITHWGRFGNNEGEFSLTPPTAVAVTVDSQGRILVGDGANERGRIQIFSP